MKSFQKYKVTIPPTATLAELIEFMNGSSLHFHQSPDVQDPMDEFFKTHSDWFSEVEDFKFRAPNDPPSPPIPEAT